ncbi:MAG TPA: MarC family protein [Candidatus Nitrosocosmicus sp.]|jgi:multiple antibiotic resistance protein|nr:MarC family protein [Candidatus Nitrosocosmicus sp.]
MISNEIVTPFLDIISYANSFGLEIMRSTIALFVVINPIGTLPLFISITNKISKQERNQVSKTAVITAGGLLIVFAVLGTQILSFFGITIASFMVAGGILLLIISLQLITSGGWKFVAGGNGGGKGIAEADESGVVPLAFPLLAGPGAITSVLLSFQTSGLVITIFSIVIVIGLTYIIYYYTDPIHRILGRRGALITTRVFAILVAAIAVQYIVDGFKSFL